MQWFMIAIDVAFSVRTLLVNNRNKRQRIVKESDVDVKNEGISCDCAWAYDFYRTFYHNPTFPTRVLALSLAL